MPAVGFLHSNEKPMAVSTDGAALKAARRYADDRGIYLKDKRIRNGMC